jgi:hypothetical protein
MPGRHQAVPGRRPRLRWLLAVAGGALIGATILALQPAAAANTVDAQLSVTGVATKANILGGSDIGVHPGDTVVFKASALPTAGLENIPALGNVLRDLLSTALGQYQVVVSFGPKFPGGAQTVTLGGPTKGKCAGVPAKSFAFPNKGTYTFTWKVQYVLPLLLGCAKNGVSDSDLNLLQKLGVALNATNSWVGKVVVADNPPPGGISIQLPGVSVAPSIIGHQLPTLGVPGITLPTIAVSVPNLTAIPSLPSGNHNSSGNGNGSPPSSSAPQNEIPVPAQVVPGQNGVPADIGGGFDSGSGGGFSSLALPGSGRAAASPVAAPDVVRPAHALPQQNSSGKHKTIDLAASRPSTGQVWVVLAIVAVIALTFVAATYARLYMLRHDK